MTARKKTPKPGDLVIVTWLDAVQHADGEVAPRHKPHTMRTCGWLLRRDRMGVSLACEMCPTDDTWRNENFIPAGMVKGVELIKLEGAQ